MTNAYLPKFSSQKHFLEIDFQIEIYRWRKWRDIFISAVISHRWGKDEIKESLMKHWVYGVREKKHGSKGNDF